MSEAISKERIVVGLLEYLERELAIAMAASREAAAYATDEESRAESKWDTQGLEASYLAAGQAVQARDWMRSIHQIRSIRELLAAPKDRAVLGALVSIVTQGFEDWYFIVPAAGGHELEIEGRLITTVTPHAPIASAMSGQPAGASFTLSNGLAARIHQLH